MIISKFALPIWRKRQLKKIKENIKKKKERVEHKLDSVPRKENSSEGELSIWDNCYQLPLAVLLKSGQEKDQPLSLRPCS